LRRLAPLAQPFRDRIGEGAGEEPDEGSDDLAEFANGGGGRPSSCAPSVTRRRLNSFPPPEYTL
jgi:hypothetical protein